MATVGGNYVFRSGRTDKVHKTAVGTENTEVPLRKIQTQIELEVEARIASPIHIPSGSEFKYHRLTAVMQQILNRFRQERCSGKFLGLIKIKNPAGFEVLLRGISPSSNT